MATIINDRDKILQATSPRLEYDPGNYIAITGTSQQFKITDTVAEPASITLSALLVGNLAGTVIWTVDTGTATLDITGNTAVLTAANLTSNVATIKASLTYLGLTYSAFYTISKVEDGEPGTQGEPGTPGANGLMYAELVVYRWTATTSQPSAPTGTGTYTWATAEYTAPADWSLTVPVNTTPGNVLWKYSINLTATAGTVTTNYDWAVPNPVTFIAASTTNFGSSTSGTATISASTQVGDTVVLFLGSDAGSTLTVPADWNTVVFSTASTVYARIAYKKMLDSVDTGIAIEGLSTASVAITRTYRGNIDFSSIQYAQFNATAGGNPNPPALAVTSGKGVIIASAFMDDDNVTTVTAPSGFGNLSWVSASTTDFNIATADQLYSSAGTIDPAAFTTTGLDDAYTTFTLALPQQGLPVPAAYLGVDGLPGAPGTRSATVGLYVWAGSTAPGTPTGTTVYTWSTGAVTHPKSGTTETNGWQSSIPSSSSPGQVLYFVEKAVVDSTGTASTSDITWAGTAVRSLSSNAGQPYRCYSKATGTSLAPSGTVTTASPTTYPAQASFGVTFGIAFQALVPTLNAGETLWICDGVLNPITNQVTWNTPYLSTFRVGSLSAWTVNTGSLTVDDAINISNTGYIRGGQTAYNTGTGFFLGYSSTTYKFSIGAPDVTASASVTTDTFTLNNHGLQTGETIRFSSVAGTLSGISVNQAYVVYNVTANTFQVAQPETPTVPINLTGTNGNVTILKPSLLWTGTDLLLNGALTVTGVIKTANTGRRLELDSRNHRIIFYNNSNQAKGTLGLSGGTDGTFLSLSNTVVGNIPLAIVQENTSSAPAAWIQGYNTGTVFEIISYKSAEGLRATNYYNDETSDNHSLRGVRHHNGNADAVGLLSARPSTGLTVGQTYYATNTGLIYTATSSTTWNAGADPGFNGGIIGQAGELGKPGFDFYADGNGTNYGPFTGTHDALVLPSFTGTIGDIVIDSEVVQKSGISSTLTLVTVSSQPNQKAALGVQCIAPYDMSPMSAYILGLDEQGQYILADGYYTHKTLYLRVAVNALGEGQINVCGEAGDIEAGDLIVTSSMPGKGMRQSDDIVRGYTVAKARESVQFSSPTEVKQIACIYLCG